MSYNHSISNKRRKVSRTAVVNNVNAGDIIQFQDTYFLMIGSSGLDYYLLNVYNVVDEQRVFCLDASYLFNFQVMLHGEPVDMQVDCTKVIAQPHSIFKNWVRSQLDVVVASVDRDDYYSIEELIRTSPFIPMVTKKVFNIQSSF